MEPITCSDLQSSLEALMAKRNSSDSTGEEHEAYQTVQKSLVGCRDANLFRKIAVEMFSWDYFFLPPELGVEILRRYVEVAPQFEKERAKAFLSQWLHRYGMENENDSEGIRLFEEIANTNVRDAPWEI